MSRSPLLRAVAPALVLLVAACAPAGTAPAASGDRGPVPAASSSSPPPVTCPPEGVLITAGSGDAAMGLRVQGFELTNCGSEPYRVTGYPGLRLLGEDRKVQRVRVLRGVEEIVGSALEWDGPPRPVVLQPGDRATAAVAWRNTYDDTRRPPVDAYLVEMAPQPGRPVQLVTPPARLDLGSTGRIGVSPWQAASSGPPL